MRRSLINGRTIQTTQRYKCPIRLVRGKHSPLIPELLTREDKTNNRTSCQLELAFQLGSRNIPLLSWRRILSLQSRRILERDPWIVFMNNVVLPSWTLILPESWDETKPDFKWEVDGFKIGEGEGRKHFLLSPPRPSPLVFSVAFQDGDHDQCTSEFSLKNACSASQLILGVKTYDVFFCCAPIVVLLFAVLPSLFSLFYINGDLHRFSHRG